MLRGIAFAGLIALMMTGCAYARFRHPQTSATAQCGVVPIPPWFNTAQAMNQVFREISCKDGLMGQGYAPIPAGPDYPYL